MPLTFSLVWDVLTAAGGTVALVLIVLIALGISAMALLFAGSAVAALERFGRVTRRPVTLAVTALLWSLALGAMVLVMATPDYPGMDARARLLAWGRLSLGAAVLVVIGMALLRTVLARVAPARLGLVAVLVLGVGTALILGAAGQLVYAATPAVAAGVAALLVSWRRGRRPGDEEAGDGERMLRVLTRALTLGPVIAFALFARTADFVGDPGAAVPALGFALVLLLLATAGARDSQLGIGAISTLALLAGLALSAVPGDLGILPVGALVIAALVLLWRRRPGTLPGIGERVVRVAAGSALVGFAAAFAVASLEPQPIAGFGLGLYSMFGFTVVVALLPLAAAGIADRRGTVEWFIAVRYLVARRRQTLISIITGICVVGIAAGVWLIITVLSVMNGFERTWRDEIIGNRAHFTVHSGIGVIENYRETLERVSASEGVIAASPYVDAEGMVRGDHGEIMAVRVRGVDPERVGLVTDLSEDLVEGELSALDPAVSNPDEPAILVGSQLAASLGVGVGDPLLLISPFGGPQTPLGPAPRLKRFRVAGVFESSFFQYDEMFTYVNIPAAQDFRRVGDIVDGIEARTTDFYRSRAVADRVQADLGFPYYTRDWKEFFPAFFQALKSERVTMFILLTMIMVVAAFSIVSTLVMMIMEKSSDIAILKTMGAEDGAIERIFALEGTLIGLVGTALGVIAGISVTAQIAWIQRQIEGVLGIDTLPASIYQFSTLPAETDASQIAIAVGVAMILALGATLLPSRQAAKLDPVESLRYE